MAYPLEYHSFRVPVITSEGRVHDTIWKAELHCQQAMKN